MRVLISTTGSSGDINPFVGVGVELHRRGHEVILVTNPHAGSKVTAAGLEFRPFGSKGDLREIADNPDVMDAKRGPETVWKDYILPEIPAMIEVVEGIVDEERPDIALSHHIFFGTQWLCARRGIPCAQATLSPMVWFSASDDSVYRHWEPRTPPRWYKRLRKIVGRWLLRRAIDPGMNRVRQAHGYPPIRDSFFNSACGGDLCLGLWSPHYRGPMPDDPEAGRICGFAWFDRHQDQESDDGAIDRFLASGEPPIVFCLGSSAVHVAGDFYKKAAEACHLLGRRGLLLTGQEDNAAFEGLDHVLAVRYAPLSKVAAAGCATVHHGGMGTMAQAMRAGKPTVIVPFAHDQFDNAARNHRLGISETLARADASAVPMTQTLRGILEDEGYARRAAELGARLAGEDGAAVAADHLEALAASR